MPTASNVIPPPDFVEMRFEAHGLVNVWREFKSDVSPASVEKLKLIMEGADLTSSESEKTEPRDILFELETAALLRNWGIDVSLGSGVDLGFEFRGLSVICECKRPQTPNALDRKLQKAASKLRDVLKEHAFPSSAVGMVVIDVSRIVHLDVAGIERYQPIVYADYLLPSSIVTVVNRNEFQRTVMERVDSFVYEHKNSFGRRFSPGIAGFMLC